MAGTVTKTTFVHKTESGRKVTRLEFDIISTGGGAASLLLEDLHGFLVRYLTNPDGSAVPTEWALTLVGAEGEDALAGGGAGRHIANTEAVLPSVPIRLDGDYTLTGATMGDTKEARVVLQLIE